MVVVAREGNKYWEEAVDTYFRLYPNRGNPYSLRAAKVNSGKTSKDFRQISESHFQSIFIILPSYVPISSTFHSGILDGLALQTPDPTLSFPFHSRLFDLYLLF
jgi:hypothetical protein